LGLDARLAAQISALDPESEPLRRVAIRIATASAIEEKVDAARAAQRHLAVLLGSYLAAPGTGAIHSDPIAGALALQLSDRVRQR
jgi:hypothetical protein